jgi:hypothetical protein
MQALGDGGDDSACQRTCRVALRGVGARSSSTIARKNGLRFHLQGAVRGHQKQAGDQQGNLSKQVLDGTKHDHAESSYDHIQ